MMEKLTEPPDIIIQQWTASVYLEKKRKWTYGTLAIKPGEMFFHADESQKDKLSFTLEYGDLTDVKKATTGLFFGAIVITTNMKKQYWISSLENREGVYSAIYHFWKAQLFRKEGIKSDVAKTGPSTKMGQKLLGIVQDSEQTLSKAGVMLEEQGRQLNSAFATMHDLHSDLDVAQNLVEGLESWVGRWRMPHEYKKMDPVIISKSDIPDVFDYEVLYTKLETGTMNAQNLGVLRISKDSLTILTMKQKSVHNYRWSDVSKFIVITPWEMKIVRYQIGKPDMVYSIVCSNMVAILRLLEKVVKYKLQYETPPDTVLCQTHFQPRTHRKDDAERIATVKKQAVSDSSHMVQHFTNSLDAQIVANQSEAIVSEREVDQISRTLGNLKSLALAVQEEESVQSDTIDKLTASVDRANERLKHANRRVKTLT